MTHILYRKKGKNETERRYVIKGGVEDLFLADNPNWELVNEEENPDVPPDIRDTPTTSK